MSFSHEYNLPYYVGTGSVLTSGTPDQLAKGQLAVIRAKTGQIVSGTIPVAQDLQIAMGSWHTVDQLGRFTGGLTQSDKTIEFKLKDIHSFERSYPRTAQSEQWAIGWDGINDCNKLAFFASTSYRFKVKVWGEDVYGTYTRPVEREIMITTGCPTTSADCQTGNCFDPVDTKIQAYALKKAIEEDPELKWFVRADVISSDYAATTPTHTLFTLTVPDLGDVQALAAVQTAYPTLQVSLLSRTGINSTYQACVINTAGTPAAYTPAGSIALQVCGTCPSGYTSVPAYDTYVITKAVSASDAIDTPSHQATYAAGVVTAYSGISGSGKFLSSNGAVAQVQINVTAGATVTPTNNTADIVTKIGSTVAQCTPPANSSISWVNAGSRYKTTQTLYFTLQKTCGGSNRLSDVQAFYAGNPTIVSGSVAVYATGTCSDKYTLQQWSNDCAVDGCLTKPVPTFTSLPWFEGQKPDVDPCATPGAVDTTTKVGVILTAAYVGNTQFANPSFFPTDYYSVRPLKLEVTQLMGIGTTNYDGEGKPCNNFIPTRKITNSSMPTQSGEFVIREYIRGNRYRVHGEFYHDVRLREVLDNTAFYAVDRFKNYITYHLKVTQDRSKFNHQGDYSPEVYEFVFAFPVGVDTTSFETYIESITAQNGVYLTNR